MTESHSAAVIDNDPESRAEVCALLEREGLTIVASVSHGSANTEVVRAAAPEVIFISFEEPILRCVQTVDYLASAVSSAAVLAYSTSKEISTFQQAVRAGARHLLQAPVQIEDIRRALSAIRGREHARAVGTSGATGRVISVVGQKGGIGKTAISVNLAAALARDTSSSVLIIDFDTTFGDVGLTMDTNSPATVAQAAHELGRMDADTFKESLSEHDSGAFVLSAPTHVGEWLNVRPAELEALVELGASLFDYVVVDTPGAYNDAVAAGIAVSDNLLIVTSLEVTSVKNTALLLSILAEEGYPEGQSQVVVNNTAFNTGLKITDTSPVLERESLWNVPYEPYMRRAGTHGAPLVLSKPTSPASQSIVALARRIAEEPNRIDRRKTLRDQTPVKRATLRSRIKAALSRSTVAAAS